MSLDYVISADSHIIEPLDLWEKALGAKWGDKVPRVVDRYNGIPGNYYFFGYDYIDLGVVQPEDAADSTEESSAMDPELADKVNRSNQDPALRLELMEMDGVQAEIVNSTFALLCMRIEHPQLVQDVCQVYNDWIVDYCSHDPRRLLASGMLPPDDVDWAVVELERLAKKDVRTVFIYTDVKPHMPPYRDRYYDPPVGRLGRSRHADHAPHRHRAACVTPSRSSTITSAIDDREDDGSRFSPTQGPILANEFIFGGVFDRFPKLKVILGEYEICVGSLVPVPHRSRSRDRSCASRSRSRRSRSPSRSIFIPRSGTAFVDDKYADRAFDVAGPTQVMWGSDFPHVRNTFPNTHKILEPGVGERGRRDQGERGGVQLRPPLRPRRARRLRGRQRSSGAASGTGLKISPRLRFDSAVPSRHFNFGAGFAGIKWDKWDSAGQAAQARGATRRELRAIAPAVARLLSLCMARRWRERPAPCSAPWSGLRAQKSRHRLHEFIWVLDLGQVAAVLEHAERRAGNASVILLDHLDGRADVLPAA